MKPEILEMTIASGLFKGIKLDDFYNVVFSVATLLPVSILLWTNAVKMDLKGALKILRTSAVVALVILIVVVAYRPAVAITNLQNNKTLIVNDPLYAKQIKKNILGEVWNRRN